MRRSRSSYRRCLSCRSYVFAMTQFWDHVDQERLRRALFTLLPSSSSLFAQETAEGKVMVDAAKSAGVRLFIWSSRFRFRPACFDTSAGLVSHHRGSRVRANTPRSTMCACSFAPVIALIDSHAVRRQSRGRTVRSFAAANYRSAVWLLYERVSS